MASTGVPDMRRAATALTTVFCLCLAAAAVPAAASDVNGLAGRLVAPWPDAEGDAGPPGTPVTFPSRSPFVLADAARGRERSPPTEAVGTLFMPADASRAAPVPAAVLLHGAAGVLHARELTYGRQLAAMGVAALVVDAFASRRDRATGFVERLLEITEMMLVADGYAGLRHLAAMPGIDGGRVVLIGFSYGAMAAVFAAYRMVAERIAPRGPRFAGHVAFYGPCIARFNDHRATGAPVLMLSGSADAIVDPARCAEIAGDLRIGGAEVRTVVYKGAYHQWDGGWYGPVRRGRNLAGCRLSVERNGVVRDRNTFLPMDGRLLRTVILAICTDSKGYLIGRDDRIRARSNRELGRFLGRIFAR